MRVMAGDAIFPSLGVLLNPRRSDLLDLSARSDAHAAFEPGADLPFDDRGVAGVWLGDAVGSLPVRDQIHLLMQCRRLLQPGAQVICAEVDAAATYGGLARWAELVGLVDLPAPRTGQGWRKRDASTDASPLVSILIPSSNPRYFSECLDSAIAQTYARIEIVICDDCESDAIAQLTAARADRATIRYVKNPERLRARLNYQKCLSLARGEYVKFLNDDDLLAPECVATLLSAFLNVPDLVLATSHRWRINSDSQVIEDMPATRPVVNRDLVIDGVSLGNAMIMHGLNFIGEPSTAMFRRRDFEPRPHLDAEGPFHFNGDEVPGAIDLAMWSRLLVQGNVAFFKKRLSRFRIHGEQAQAQPQVVARSVDGIRGLQKQWISLGLFRRLPPHLLLCQPLARSEAEANDWSVVAARSLPSSGLPKDEAIRAWRATRRHGFESEQREEETRI